MDPEQAGPLTDGARTSEELVVLGQRVRSVVEVDRVVPGESFRWRTVEGADAEGTRSIRPIGPTSCELVFTKTVRLRGRERLLAPLLRRTIRRTDQADAHRAAAPARSRDLTSAAAAARGCSSGARTPPSTRRRRRHPRRGDPPRRHRHHGRDREGPIRTTGRGFAVRHGQNAGLRWVEDGRELSTPYMPRFDTARSCALEPGLLDAAGTRPLGELGDLSRNLHDPERVDAAHDRGEQAALDRDRDRQVDRLRSGGSSRCSRSRSRPGLCAARARRP